MPAAAKTSLLAKNLDAMLTSVDYLTSGQMGGPSFFLYTWGPDLEPSSVVEVRITRTPGARPTRSGENYAHWGSDDDKVELIVYAHTGKPGRVHGWTPGQPVVFATRTAASEAYLLLAEPFIRAAALWPA